MYIGVRTKRSSKLTTVVNTEKIEGIWGILKLSNTTDGIGVRDVKSKYRLRTFKTGKTL